MAFIDLQAHFPMHTKFAPRVGSDRVEAKGKKLEFRAASLFRNFAAGKPRLSLSEFEAHKILFGNALRVLTQGWKGI